VRGRVQVEWRCSNQTRANTQRDWLNLQLSGRSFISEDLPKAKLVRGVWLTLADVAFDTVAEGDTVTTLALARMAADSFIQAGSSVQVHTCKHDDGVNDCAATLTRTVK